MDGPRAEESGWPFLPVSMLKAEQALTVSPTKRPAPAQEYEPELVYDPPTARVRVPALLLAGCTLSLWWYSLSLIAREVFGPRLGFTASRDI